MAMSQGERMARLLQEQGRYRSRQQTKDSSHQTLIVQAKASTVVFPQNRTPDTLTIEGSRVIGPTDKGIPANIYSSDGAPIGCCATVVANGSETFDQQNALLQKAQGCAICSTQDYWLYDGYAIDMSGEFIKGGYTCPIPNQVNTAKTTEAQQCAACLKFYFPSPAQPTCCYNTPYESQYLYPPQPIDWELRRYGDSGTVPQVPETTTDGR